MRLGHKDEIKAICSTLVSNCLMFPHIIDNFNILQPRKLPPHTLYLESLECNTLNPNVDVGQVFSAHTGKLNCY